jgi:N-acetylmuramoyl-L-alanine amidase
MKKLITSTVLGFSLLIASPAFAYEVKSGDTMSEIAVNHNMSLQELAKINPQIADLNVIYVGQTINTGHTHSEAQNGSNQSFNVSSYERDLLARLVRAEAQNEPYSGKVAVAVTVLNRVDHNSFPNTIREVIYQKGQFTPVSNGSINKPADAESIRAVNEALAFRGQGQGSLFFYNPATATNRWLDSRPTTIVIGNHVFKK